MWAGRVPTAACQLLCPSMILFLRHVLACFPHSCKISHLLLLNYIFNLCWGTIWFFCSLFYILFFEVFVSHNHSKPFLMESVYEVLFSHLSVLQFLNLLPFLPDLIHAHRAPVPSVPIVPEPLEHILAVPKHSCLGTSNDACRLDHGTCHLFHPTIGLQWERGHVLLCTSLSSVLIYFCSRRFSFLLPSVLVLTVLIICETF